MLLWNDSMAALPSSPRDLFMKVNRRRGQRDLDSIQMFTEGGNGGPVGEFIPSAFPSGSTSSSLGLKGRRRVIFFMGTEQTNKQNS